MSDQERGEDRRGVFSTKAREIVEPEKKDRRDRRVETNWKDVAKDYEVEIQDLQALKNEAEAEVTRLVALLEPTEQPGRERFGGMTVPKGVLEEGATLVKQASEGDVLGYVVVEKVTHPDGTAWSALQTERLHDSYEKAEAAKPPDFVSEPSGRSFTHTVEPVGVGGAGVVDVVAAVRRDSEGRVWLAKRNADGAHAGLAGMWEYPGGKVEPNEQLREALVRELGEEFPDVTVEIGRVLDSIDATLEGSGVGEDGLAVRVYRVTFFEVTMSDPTELPCHTEARWMTPDEACSVDHLPSGTIFNARHLGVGGRAEWIEGVAERDMEGVWLWAKDREAKPPHNAVKAWLRFDEPVGGRAAEPSEIAKAVEELLRPGPMGR